MRYFRHHGVLPIFGFFLLVLLGASYLACLGVPTHSCCNDDDERKDFSCSDGPLCHCACAYSGILFAVEVASPIPDWTTTIYIDTAIGTISMLAGDLFRPPRVA